MLYVKLTSPPGKKFPRRLNGAPAYGSRPVVGSCSEISESREFFSGSRSFVDAKTVGPETTKSPGQTRRSRFPPSTSAAVPFVMV